MSARLFRFHQLTLSRSLRTELSAGRVVPLGLSGINRTGAQGYATVVSLAPLHPGLT